MFFLLKALFMHIVLCVDFQPVQLCLRQAKTLKELAD